MWYSVEMKKQTIGFLHPGAMGVSLAASAIASGHVACWVPGGRSDATRERAEAHGLKAIADLEKLCEACGVIVSICPPSASEDVARSVIECGFNGLYLDANAISPARARRIADRVNGSGAAYIDGSVIGGPAWTKDETVLYLSGPRGEEMSGCFAGGLLATRVIGDQVDRASALKMCYAAYTKGSMAMLSAIVGAAHALGVDDELAHQWELDEPGSAARTHARMCRVTAKAWRFAGEMDEIADTLGTAGLPRGFHEASAEVYARMGPLKDRGGSVDIETVLAHLLGEVGESAEGQE